MRIYAASSETTAQAAQTVTIAAGQSLSDAVDLNGQAPVMLVMPAGWTAADITFQVSVDGVNFKNLYSGSTEYKLANVGADRAVLVPLGDVAGFERVKLRSGTAAAPVAQATGASVVIVSRGL